MGAATGAHAAMVTLLGTYAPSPLWANVYSTHRKANLVVPSVSVEVETDTPLADQMALVSQELVDNRNIRLSVRVHTSYRLGPVDHALIVSMTDDVIRWVREHINLGGGYRVFDVAGASYVVEHTTSGTVGAEILIDIHKVEYYEQA
jgi:hypothetical protein